MAFRDKNQFGTGSREDRTAAPLPSDSLDDEMEKSEDEFADDDELVEFTAADWKRQFPDYSVEEFAEKVPDRTRSTWMAPTVGCMFGTLLGAAIAGLLVNDLPRSRQLSMFFVYFVVFAVPLSLVCWLFIVRSQRLAKKMTNQQANPTDQETNPAVSGPIHPK